jgi:hypothetical protein
MQDEKQNFIPKQQEEEPAATGWRSACFTLDPHFTTFVCQFIISFAALVLCVSQLWVSDSCESQSFYGNILTTLLGLWMPSPLALKHK